MECIIDDVPIYYREIGSGMPILFIHGFAVDHRILKRSVETALVGVDGYRRIYVDLPGMGQTPSRPWINSAKVVVQLLKKFIDVVIGKEPFLLFGNSYGGYLALGLAVEVDFLIEGLFLLSPAVIADRRLRVLPEVDVRLEEGVHENFQKMFYVKTPETFARFESEILTGLSIMDRSFLREFRSNYALDVEDKFKRMAFNKPVTVLTGKKDVAVGYEDQWRILNHLPLLTFLTLEGVGHNLQIESPSVFVIMFREWLHQIKGVPTV